MKDRNDELRFSVIGDTVDGVRAAADAYLREVGATPHVVNYSVDMMTDTFTQSDGEGRVRALQHGPIRGDVTAWLHPGGPR